MRPIALLSDFGLADPYAGQLRASLARRSPQSQILDITHQVEPFAVDQAAFFLAASAAHFPADAVFVCVVDPGVGSTRRIIGARVETEAGGQDFLAPDNGLLGLLLFTPGLAPARVFDLSGAAASYEASATFHGRDVFAPLAARLAHGESMVCMGQPMDRADIERPAWADPSCGPMGVDARLLHVDRYGNCLLSLRANFEAPKAPAWLRMPWGQRRGIRPVHTYSDLGPGEIGLLSGSQGFMELAANQAAAAEALGLRRGDSVRLLWG
jgi:hypothetical protein